MKYLFGPVPSRRLGYSLGIDILPAKTCNMNCIYCELGKGEKVYQNAPSFPPYKEIIKEITDYCAKSEDHFDCLTFTASGEPTLHKDIEKLITEAKKLTSKKVAVLTNSSTTPDPHIRKALGQADLVLPSLDAARQKTFQKINRPHPSLKIKDIIEGLIGLRREMAGQMWLEILFVQDINDTQQELLALKNAIEAIKPHRIQLNTIARPPAEEWARPISSRKMEEIQRFFGKKAEVVIDFKAHMNRPDGIILESEIVDTLKRRPLSLKDFEGLFGQYHRAEKILNTLLRKGIVQEKRIADRTFFTVQTRNNF